MKHPKSRGFLRKPIWGFPRKPIWCFLTKLIFSNSPQDSRKLEWSSSEINLLDVTEWMECMSHRKLRETKQQPSMLPGPAVPGWCLVTFYFLCDNYSIHSVVGLVLTSWTRSFFPYSMTIQSQHTTGLLNSTFKQAYMIAIMPVSYCSQFKK